MPFSFTTCREFLSQELLKRIKINPNYSQRSFAKQLGISPGELSEILTGKRKLSLRSVNKIALTLGLNETEIKHLLYLLQREQSHTSSLPESLSAEPKELSAELFAVISDWYHVAILNLTECDGFKWDEKWISHKLGIQVAEVRTAIHRMKRLGLLETRKGELSVTKDYHIASNAVPSSAIRNYHRQILNKALASIELQTIQERELSGATFAIDPKDIPEIKKEVSNHLKNIAMKYSKKKRKKEVYHLEMVLFRLTEKVSHDS